MLHGDHCIAVQASNVLIAENGNVKISGAGLALNAAVDAEAPVDTEQMYLAPETLAGGECGLCNLLSMAMPESHARCTLWQASILFQACIMPLLSLQGCREISYPSWTP